MTARQSSWAAAALYLALTFLLAYPLSVTANRTLPADDPDGHLFMWTLAWDVHAFVHQPVSIFDANIFYPNRDSLAYSENLIGSAFFAAPVLWLTGNPVLAVNVISLLSCMLCGLGAYVLGRRVGLSAAAAVLAGLIFAFSPPRFFRFSQLHLTAVQWIPFALGSLHAYLDGGRKRDLRLAAAFFTLQVLTSGHGGVFASVAIFLLLTYRLALGEPILLARRRRDFGIVGTLLLIPVALFAIPYRIAQIEVGLRRGLGGWDTPIEDFFASATRVDVFLQSLITSKHINAMATAWLFPGFLPVILALVAIVLGGATLARGMRLPRPSEWRPTAAVMTAREAYRRPLLWLLSGAISWTLLGVTRQALPAGNGLTGQYYANAKWDGRPVMSVVDSEPSTEQMMQRWNNEPPPTFAVAWNGYLSVARPGLYFFATASDDRSRLYIDNQIVIDNTGGHPSGQAGSIRLAHGPHRVVLEYVHVSGGSTLKWEWAFEGDHDNTYRVVPRWALSRRPANDAATIAIRIVGWARWMSAILAALAFMWCVLAWRTGRQESWERSFAPYRRNPTAFYLLLTVACVALALGPPYGLWQFVYWLPGFNFIRGSSRFMVLGLLGIAVLAGVGFDWLIARLAPAPRRLAATVAGGLLVVEFSAIPFRGVPYQLEIPATDRWVAEQSKPFVVAEMPSGRYERYQTMYMLYSMAHWQKTVHGYSGIRPELHDVLYRELEHFPDRQSLQHLQQLGVTYVIVHTDMYSPDEWADVDQRLHSFGEWLNLEHSDATGRVYALRRPQ